MQKLSVFFSQIVSNILKFCKCMNLCLISKNFSSSFGVLYSPHNTHQQYFNADALLLTLKTCWTVQNNVHSLLKVAILRYKIEFFMQMDSSTYPDSSPSPPHLVPHFSFARCQYFFRYFRPCHRPTGKVPGGPVRPCVCVTKSLWITVCVQTVLTPHVTDTRRVYV